MVIADAAQHVPRRLLVRCQRVFRMAKILEGD